MTLPQQVVHTTPMHTTPAAGERAVATIIDGVPTVITCPSWCTLDHAAENFRFIEDVDHVGPETALSVPRHNGDALGILGARLVQTPYARQRRAMLSLEVTEDDHVDLTAEAASALADQVIAHGVALRELARRLGELEG